MQVARYWRMKQHLYQLTVDADKAPTAEQGAIREPVKQPAMVTPAVTTPPRPDAAKLLTVA